MRNVFKRLHIGSAILSICLMISCGSDDDQTPISTSEVSIEEAKLSDFPLFGITSTNVEINDPEIVNNKEVKPGEIKIIVPSRTALDKISVHITSDELNLSKFNISPGNDVELSYENHKKQVYAITTATGDKEELLHYTVSIVKEVEPVPETLKITGFSFEKSKNPDLPNDIEISRTIEDTGLDKIYLFVPVGTDFTDLIPTITYDGTKLYYTQDSSVAPVDMNVEYPTEDTSIDFKYPKDFILTVRDRNNDKLKTTVVIVDVKNPVRIETVSVTTPDTKENTSGYYNAITEWTNQGNHMINNRSISYEELNPNILGSDVIQAYVASLPSGGVPPGESRGVNIVIAGSGYYPEFTYKATAVFYPKIEYNEGVNDLLEPARLEITSKIIK